ncbi:hypothetical protein JKF63_05975 [Porcisia hertigi]|uniref:Uncharacterized protein n=1 Tax=Porcisia hertigi TaxID=2761500 RepID=A0A836HVC6_9TRYP|nr:hypothetical protein JKF63_05975 [Porcisia hertigi]
MYSGIDHHSRRYGYLGYGREAMHGYPQPPQPQYANTLTRHAPQHADWAESRPGRTPCKKDWWLHVLSDMRVVDSPRGINLDVEDEQADVMVELKRTALKDQTELSGEASTTAPDVRGASASSELMSDAQWLSETSVSTTCTAGAEGEVLWEKAGLTCRQKANPHERCDRQPQSPPPAQASLNATIQPGRHFYGVNYKTALNSEDESRSSSCSAARATLDSTSHKASSCRNQHPLEDNGAITRSLHDQPDDQPDNGPAWPGAHLDDSRILRRPPPNAAESEEDPDGEHTRKKEQCNADGRDGARSATRMQPVLRRYPNTHRYSIYDSQVLQSLPEATPEPGGPRPRPDNSDPYMIISEHTHGHVETDDTEDNHSDEDSVDGSSVSSPSSSSDTDDYYDSDGSETYDESEYSKTPPKWQSTLDYSALNEGAAARYSGSLPGAAIPGRCLHPEASTSLMPSVGLFIRSPAHPLRTTAANGDIRDNAKSLSSLDHCVAHAASATTALPVNENVTTPRNSVIVPTGVEDASRHSDAVDTLCITASAPVHAAHTAPVGAAYKMCSRRPSKQPGTATATVPLEAAKDTGPTPTQTRQTVSEQISKSHPVETPERSSGTRHIKSFSNTAVTTLSRSPCVSERQHCGSGDAVPVLHSTKLASEDPYSSQAATPTPTGERASSVSPCHPHPPSISKEKWATAKTQPQREGAMSTTPAIVVDVDVKMNAATDDKPIKAKELQAQSLPVTRNTLHTLTKPQGSVPASMSHGKKPRLFRHIHSTPHSKPCDTASGVDQANTPATSVTSHPSTESSQSPSARVASVTRPTEAGRSILANGGGEAWGVAAAAAVSTLKSVVQPHSSPFQNPTASNPISPSLAGGAPVLSEKPTLAAGTALPPAVNKTKVPAGPQSVENTTAETASTRPNGVATSAISSGGSRLGSAARLPQVPQKASAKPSLNTATTSTASKSTAGNKKLNTTTGASEKHDGVMAAPKTPLSRTAELACGPPATAGAVNHLGT